MAETLESHLVADHEIPVLAASRASLPTVDPYLPAVVGFMVGAVVHFTLGIGPQGLLQGLGAGLGFAIGLVLADRGARADSTQPGGFAVVLAVTRDDLVIFDQDLWGKRTTRVAGRVPLTEIDAIGVTKRLVSTKIEIRSHDARRWRYLVHRWAAVRAALPSHLAG